MILVPFLAYFRRDLGTNLAVIWRDSGSVFGVISAEIGRVLAEIGRTVNMAGGRL